MQILITAGPSSPTRVYQFTALSLVVAAIALIVPLMGLSVALYHAVVLEAARKQWPIISDAVRFVERQEQAQQHCDGGFHGDRSTEAAIRRR